MNPDIEDLLREIGSVDLSPSNLKRMESNFDLWFEMLEKWNRSINLVSRSGPSLVDHLYDSLQYLRVFPEKARFLDLGSGAGFPGVALKIVRPALEAIFLEGRKKRANFLKILTREMKMESVQVVWGRAEEVLHEQKFRSLFDFVTAKGVGVPDLCLELGGGFLKEGGVLVVKQSYDQAGGFPGFILDKEIPIQGISGTKSKLLAFSKCST